MAAMSGSYTWVGGTCDCGRDIHTAVPIPPESLAGDSARVRCADCRSIVRAAPTNPGGDD